MLPCYNRGCGKDFDPDKNTDESCCHHPGVPFFHDAYKGWTCCNKKSVDFTEFLNIKGCQLSKHSNIKPVEPEKQNIDVKIEEIPEQPKPVVEQIKPSTMQRPDFNSALETIEPIVAPILRQSIDNLLTTKSLTRKSLNDGEITIGSTCKNGGCNCTYESSDSNRTTCVYHPGVPIFHEGMKYWSCCTKRTTDFSAFLNQKGCTEGCHKWIQNESESTIVKCRYDWHQTATNVVIAIYAKMYHYAKSYVKMNPIRLSVSLLFPQQQDALFGIDLELRGIVDVNKTKVQMYGTKVEITLTKAEPGTWVNLDFPRQIAQPNTADSCAVKQKIDNADDDDSDVDLNSIEAVNSITITEA